jgi:hypothetical protein
MSRRNTKPGCPLEANISRHYYVNVVQWRPLCGKQGEKGACMHDLGITTSRNLSLQDQELLLDTREWRALLQAEIQSSKNQLDSMAKKQTRKCEHQAKRQEAREYLRDKKGPSKFCGNTHSSQMPNVLGMPEGVMWIIQEDTQSRQ